MSIRIISTLVAVASLVLVAGCATGEDLEEDAPSGESGESAEAMPQVEVETGNVSVEATGFTCSCPSGQELDGGICYPSCQSGYRGIGPMCYENCKAGYTNNGLTCGRGASIVSANTKSCPWYDKCGIGLKKGCSTCPSGYKNDGCTCRRDASTYLQASFGRGAGTALSCSTN